MNWLTLSNVSAVLYITVDVIIIYYVFPAFRQTGQRAFVLIGAACIIGAFDTICDHTIGHYPMSPDEHLAYRTLRYFSHYAATVLDTVGVVLLTRSYLRIFSTKPSALPGGDLQ